MNPASLMNNYGSPPVCFVSGAGAELWDDTGKRYLDFLSGLAVTSLGHAHPAVTEALTRQAARLLHTSNLFANEPTAAVVSGIDQLVRGDDPSAEPGRILFQNSGAEANEAAIKLARKYQGRGRHVVISAFGSFHGRTLATLAATGQPSKHEPFQPLPEEFRHVAWNDLDALASALGPEVGTVLLEPLQGEGGVNPAGDGYLRGVRELCSERGILLVMDEIQTGLGRTGRWFGFQHAGISPDIVTMAKALGNGVPVGAVWARPDVAEAFRPGDHGSTFAGQPLVLSVVQTVLETLRALDAPALAHRKGAMLRSQLSGLSGVASVRGLGLLLAAELSPDVLVDRTAPEIASACLQRGLVVNGVTQTALRFAPPFIVDDTQLASAAAIVDSVLEDGS